MPSPTSSPPRWTPGSNPSRLLVARAGASATIRRQTTLRHRALFTASAINIRRAWRSATTLWVTRTRDMCEDSLLFGSCSVFSPVPLTRLVCCACVVQADASWQGDGWVGTAACWITKLSGDGTAPERFDATGNSRYLYANPRYWPQWGGDLIFGYSEPPAIPGTLGANGYCTQAVYTAADYQVCGGGDGAWGATDLVVLGR